MPDMKQLLLENIVTNTSVSQDIEVNVTLSIKQIVEMAKIQLEFQGFKVGDRHINIELIDEDSKTIMSVFPSNGRSTNQYYVEVYPENTND